MFPVTFAASVNISTLVVVLLPIVFSIVAVVKGFIIKKTKLNIISDQSVAFVYIIILQDNKKYVIIEMVRL